MFRRISALVMALLLCLSCAALGEETYVPEVGEIALPGCDAPVVNAPDDLVEAAPEAADPAALPETRVFSSMEKAGGETWESVELLRAQGYTGKLASVTGTLKLIDVMIEGVAADASNLLDYFELQPGASIVCSASGSLGLNVSALALNKGATKQLSLTSNGASVSAKKARWSTSNGSVAKVSSKGKLTGRGTGTAVVTVTYNGEKAVCRVYGTNFVNAKKIKLEKSSADLALYGTLQLKPVLSPENADPRSVSWSSSDDAVASVDSEGLVSGLAQGVATIRATLANGKYASCRLNVRYILPTEIKFNRGSVGLRPGDTCAMTVTTVPESVSDPGFQFYSRDTAVCTIDEEGVITAVGYGATEVVAACAADPSLIGTCAVNVLSDTTPRLTGLTIGINPGHQIKTIKKRYPIAPWSTKKAKGVKTGACGHYTKVNEYETNLQIGLKLKRILEEMGAEVVITRTTNDVMLTNIDRAEMLNAANVDIALQLHCNTSPHSSHRGCSGYIRTTGDWVEVSREMAATLTRAISETCGCPDLGVKIQNEFMSLNWTTTPSVLLEMGYLTNREEDHLLASDEYRELMAQGICEGICRYFGR